VLLKNVTHVGGQPDGLIVAVLPQLAAIV